MLIVVISCGEKISPPTVRQCDICDTLNRSERVINYLSQIVEFQEVRIFDQYDPDSSEFDSNDGSGIPEFFLCNAEIFGDKNYGKIVKWSGYLHSTCDSVFQYPLAEIETIEFVHYCPKSWPELGFEPDLFNANWQLASMHLGDTILYPPCEMAATRIGFYQSAGGLVLLRANIGANSYGFDGAMNWDDSLYVITGGTVTDADASSYAVRFFESAFNSVINEGDRVFRFKYDGLNLVMTNTEDQSYVSFRAVSQKD